MSVISCRLSVISYQLSVISCQLSEIFDMSEIYHQFTNWWTKSKSFFVGGIFLSMLKIRQGGERSEHATGLLTGGPPAVFDTTEFHQSHRNAGHFWGTKNCTAIFACIDWWLKWNLLCSRTTRGGILSVKNHPLS